MPFHGENYLSEKETSSENFSFTKLPSSKIQRGPFSENNTSQSTLKLVDSVELDFEFPNANFNVKKDKSEKVNTPEITGWRRAIINDKPAIRQLQNLTGDIANLLYRKRNIDDLIEKSYFSIVQLDSNGELISFTAYDPFPNIPTVPSFFWSEWLDSMYRIKGACPRNVLFIHYMVWQPQHTRKFLRLLLETSFREFLHLKHIIIVKPPKTYVPEFYEEYFIPALPSNLEMYDLNSIQSLWICLRESIVQSLPIRLVFEEEIDIILPFIKSHITSEHIGKKPYLLDYINFIYSEEKKTLICELEGRLAGIMILNLKIDLDYLNEGFELAPFNGLRKKNMKDNEYHESTTHLSAKTSSKGIHDCPDPLISSEFLFSKMNWEMKRSKTRDTNSLLDVNESIESFVSNSENSNFSMDEFPSLLDIKSSKLGTAESQKLSNALTIHSKNEFQSKPIDFKVRMRASINSLPRFYFPKFCGPINAFVIDFFAIDSDKIDEKLSSYDFLEAAFKVVPDRDYCVLIIPTDLIPFPLLDLFVRVTPRIMSSFKQELYLCHKNSLLVTSMTIRNITEDDLLPISNFLRNVNDSQEIYQDILNSFSIHREFKSYVFTVDEKIIGVSLIDTLGCAEQCHLYFDLANCKTMDIDKPENISLLKHLILNPIYNNHTRFFVRDIIRLADLNFLFYTHNDRNKDSTNINTILAGLLPIKPKRKVGLVDQTDLLLASKKAKYETPLSLHITSQTLCGYNKIHLNIMIVVVGASRTAMSFFENLIYKSSASYVIYNNLICVTPHCLETKDTEEFEDLMFPVEDNFSKKYLSMLSLETYVSFVYGIMTEINRSEKYIVINNKEILRYDYLILTCGLQYLAPLPKPKEKQQNQCCKKFYGSSLSRYLHRSHKKKIVLPKHPINLFVVNTGNDAKNALHTLKYLMRKAKNNTDKKIIIYGHNIHVFLTINTLLKLGVPGDILAFVEPFPSSTKTVTIFNDPHIDQAVRESLLHLKVTYYKEYFLYDWVLASEDYITSITFQSNHKQLSIPCLAFFATDQKLVPDVTFYACNGAGLVYDGRLIINHNFKTNDKYIYAAGPFTKYSKRYFANDQDHQFFNSAEVGQKLADIIRGLIDPSVKQRYEKSNLVPQLVAPLLTYCQLPGEFNLLLLRKPGKMLDLETSFNFVNYGDVLITGDCKMQKGYGYFRLHLNSEGFVESITCFTKDKIDYINMYSLYGLHESLLNDLILRYDLGHIPDFFSYFREPWTMALFHEKFQFVRDYNYKAFVKKKLGKSKKNFIDFIMDKLMKNKWQRLPESIRHRIFNEYKHVKLDKEIEKNLLQFLEYFSEELPVYSSYRVKRL